MNGGHDLGGMHGLGPIAPEPEGEEPVFHAEWERRAFALTLAMGALGQWNIDMSRHARERQHPADYLRRSYYENWLAGLETLLIESGMVTIEELRTGFPRAPAPNDLRARVLTAGRVGETLAKGGPAALAVEAAPRFRAGDQVRVRNLHPEGHTRAPRYVRGRLGTIQEHHGAHVIPDLNAAASREGGHLYGVRFAAVELWGEPFSGPAEAREASERLSGQPSEATSRGSGAVHIDLWECYLEPAP